MTDNPNIEALQPGATPKATPQFLDPTWSQSLRVWWSFFWPQALVAGVLDFIAFANPLARFLIVSAVMIGAMEYALSRSFPDFHVELVRPLQGDPQPLPKTFTRVFSITWEYAWRIWFYSLVLGLFVALPILFVVGPKPLDSIAANVVFWVVGAAMSYYIFSTHIVNGIVDDAQVEFISNP